MIGFIVNFEELEKKIFFVTSGQRITDSPEETMLSKHYKVLVKISWRGERNKKYFQKLSLLVRADPPKILMNQSQTLNDQFLSALIS